RYANDLTLLMWAAGQGHLDTVRMLLSRGADPKARDDRGKTALAIAAEAGHAAEAEALRAAGATE
ncbi:MAG TPA: ankyrin repeat domain-containing protein, partial [Anaeromyxobacteraceae bacterium]|nr:ankyrin repeat domain-containing protein [Anaeromyxobacteraceae bacterium]